MSKFVLSFCILFLIISSYFCFFTMLKDLCGDSCKYTIVYFPRNGVLSARIESANSVKFLKKESGIIGEQVEVYRDKNYLPVLVDSLGVNITNKKIMRSYIIIEGISKLFDCYKKGINTKIKVFKDKIIIATPDFIEKNV